MQAVPTNAIVGAEDPGTTPAAAEAIRREIAGSNLVVVPGVLLRAEEPATFHDHVLAFLDRQGRT